MPIHINIYIYITYAPLVFGPEIRLLRAKRHGHGRAASGRCQRRIGPGAQLGQCKTGKRQGWVLRYNVCIYIYIYTHLNILIFIFIYIYILRKPASWLVAVCERSEDRGCGGGVVAEREWNLAVPRARKQSILPGYVPLGNLLTVGYRFPLGPPFCWPERPWGCIGKHDIDQRKSCKILWKMEETGANARNKPWRGSKDAGKI